MPRIQWDKDTERLYETGVKNAVLYPKSSSGYGKGVGWNGVTSISENPSGADVTDLWADNSKYLSLRSAEDFGLSIEAYMYPDEWMECDGSAEPETGVIIGQQTRKSFGLCYRTEIGNDVDFDSHGYKLHLVYNASASPSERSYQTINDSPEAITFSWEITTTPVKLTGDYASYKPTACITIDSTKADPDVLAALEDLLYGTDPTGSSGTGTDPQLPSIETVIGMFAEEDDDETP